MSASEPHETGPAVARLQHASEERLGPSPPLHVAFVLDEYPVRSETFIQREIRSLQQDGECTLHIVALRSRLRIMAAAGHTRRSVGWLQLWPGAIVTAAAAPRRTLALLRAAPPSSRFKARLRWYRAMLVALYLAPVMARARVELIHAHFAGRAAEQAAVLARWLGVPWGLSVHAHDVYAAPSALADFTATAAHVITCSEIAAADVRALLPGVQRQRVRRCHHGVDLGYWQQRRAWASRIAPPIVLAIGRLEPKKGFVHLVGACSLLRSRGVHFSCVIVGDGTQSEFLRNEVAARGLEDCVRFAGWQSEDAVREQLLGATALAVPSVISGDGDRDNIPNVVVEALASGTPIVASALPALDALLRPHRAALLVPAGDAAALAHALADVLDDPRLREQLGHNGADLARSEFDLARNTRKLAAILVESARGEPALREVR
jgi:glycosyltransferase involved in cell wall biosynthesis